MTHSSAISASLLGLILLGGLPATAQTLYNQGSTITVSPGATLYVAGDFEQTPGAIFQTNGATRVTGNVQSATGATLDLGVGELSVAGHVTSAGATQSTSTGTLRLNGSANQNLSLNGSTVGRLVIDKSVAGQDTTRILTDVTVQEQLTLTNGMVRTRPSSAVRIPAGGLVSSEADGRYVQGHLIVTRSAVAGNTPVDFQNGVSINPAGNALGDVTVDRTAGLMLANVSYAQSANNPGSKSIDRIWAIQPQQQPAAGQPAQLTMRWLASDDNGLTAADLLSAQAQRRLTPGGPWAAVGPVANATSRELTVSTSTFSDWTVGSSNAPLPVELLTFTATRIGDAARIQWTTASEKNSDFFEVQVSPNGRDYTYVGRVAAAGTSQQRHDYELRDPRLLAYGASVVYYRLRQVDRDGAATLLGPQTIRVRNEREPLAAQAWPNPFDGAAPVQLLVRAIDPTPVHLTITDATGRLVAQRPLTMEPGTATVSLEETRSLPIGFYLLRVRQGAEMVTLRLVRQ